MTRAADATSAGPDSRRIVIDHAERTRDVFWQG